MVQENNPYIFGFTAEEQISLKALTARLPLGWRIALETTDDDETDARVVPPWGGRMSAFLIDREPHGMIITDNLTAEAGPVTKIICDVRDAIDYITAVLAGIVFY